MENMEIDYIQTHYSIQMTINGWRPFFRDLIGTATSVTALHIDFIQPGTKPLKFWDMQYKHR